MILVDTWQIIRRFPYLLPAVLLILVWVALGYAWQAVTTAGNCPDCEESKGLCLVACERVARRLDEIDRQVAIHPCTGCPGYQYGCDALCPTLQRWELYQ